jgi:hypothetical protein
VTTTYDIEPRGGFDGVLVSFGEGTDDDTNGWFAFEDGEVRVFFREHNDEGDEVVLGERQSRPFAELIGVEIY